MTDSEKKKKRSGYVAVSESKSVKPGDPAWYRQDFPAADRLKRKADIPLHPVCLAEEKGTDEKTAVIRIRPEEERQEILGFGTSLEESTIYNLYRMEPEAREKLLRSLIDPENGYGMTWFRLTIGTADFTAREFYTYYDCPPEGNYDWENRTGRGFSIEKDHQYHIVETVQQILAIAEELHIRHEIHFFASPWTPPGWMKLPTPESDSYEKNELLLKGGVFNSDYTEALAVYYVRYLEEYARLGIPIHAMTLQNEPYLDIDYPSCLMTPGQQAALAEALKNEIERSRILKEAKVNPQIWGFDHNFDDGWKYVREIAGTKGWDCLDGLAFHSYAGDPGVMREIGEAYPDKKMHLTERMVWGAQGAGEIITWLRQGACSYCSWVTMLDSEIKTHQWVGTPGPTMFIQDARRPDIYRTLPEAAILGQFSRYIRPGYVCVDSSDCGEELFHVACRAPGGESMALVISNPSSRDRKVRVICGNEEFETVVMPGTVSTCVW